MTDQQRGSAGWPAPVDPDRQAAAPNRSAHRGGVPDEDPPWLEEAPWDRPAESAWPEPEPDFAQWYDEADPEPTHPQPTAPVAAPARYAEQANAPMASAYQPQAAPADYAAPTSPAYPAPTPAPYATPTVPPYAAPIDPRRPDATAPYAAAGRPVYAPPQAVQAAKNGRPVNDPPPRFGNRFATAQPAVPTPRPVTPAMAWDEDFAPPPTLSAMPTREPAAPSAFKDSAVPGVVFAPAVKRADALDDDNHEMPAHMGEPYDEFAPLADDVAFASAGKERDESAAPEPPLQAAPAAPTHSSPRPTSTSVFGDLFVGAPAAPPRRDVQPVAPPTAMPVTPVPAAAEADFVEFAEPEPAGEVTEPATEATESAAEEPEPAPSADWPPATTSFAPKPWESVSRPTTPWAGQRDADRQTQPPAARPTPTTLDAPAFVVPGVPAPSVATTASSSPPWVAGRWVPSPSAQPTPASPQASGSPEMTDPTSASLAEPGMPDDIWSLAPETQGDPATTGTDPDEEDQPSTISTLFWTVVTGVLVVALVLAFLHFLTGVFR